MLAVPSLEACTQLGEVVLVVTRPDRPAGRGLRPSAPPIEYAARARGLPVEQPASIRDASFVDRLRALRPDVAIVVAYGRIFPPAVLAVPARGCVNVHASLLPRWRGAAPIERAIAAGDTQTGVCLMRMDEGLDTGPIIACVATPIGSDETAGDLGERLARLGAELLARELPAWLAGERPERPQPAEGVCMAPPVRGEEAAIDWARPARAVHDHVRAMNPRPIAHTRIGARRLLVHRTRPAASEATGAAPGTVLDAARGRLEIACAPGSVEILELQLEGRRKMSTREALGGLRLRAGDRLGETA